MKRMIRVLVAAAVLVTSLTCSAFAATTDYTEDKSTNAAGYVGTVDYDSATGKYTASYDGIIEGEQYVLMVASIGASGNWEVTQDSIQYIDQTAAGSNISFTFIPKTATDSVVLLGGKFADGQSPKVLGALKMPYMLGDVDLDGSVMPNDAYTTLQMYVGLLSDYTNTQFMAADVDFDSQIMPNDAYKILQYYVGLITEF